MLGKMEQVLYTHILKIYSERENMKYIKAVLLSVIFIFLLSGCADDDNRKYPYYDAFTYNDLTKMVESIPIDFSKSVEKLDIVYKDIPELTAYIDLAKSNQYTAAYIMTGMYAENNGLLYNYYTEDDNDYYFEQFTLCDNDEDEVKVENITFLLGISGRYFDSDAENGLYETDEEKQLTLFFEDFTYSEAYEVSIGNSFYHCEIWLKSEDKPYYFYFKDNKLLAAQTYLSNGKEIVYYFTEFSNEPKLDRIK